MRALQLLIIFSLLSICSAFEVSPTNPNPGNKITLTGTASPNEAVSLRSTFSMNLPVAAGQYEYETQVNIPQKPNRFTVTARNVQDFNAGVKLVIWITKSFPASSGTARISQADIPPGEYNLKMFGEALPGSTAVPVKVEAETQVKADSQGNYVLDIDTRGIPAGEYRIEAAGVAKTIKIGSTQSASSSSGGSLAQEENGGSEAIPVKQTAKPVEITPYVVRWYANKTGLKIENTSQFEQAEELLKKRLAGDYWKIIARGEPLTEEAGDCPQEYCLVRGVDACTVCRDKDIILKGSQASNKSQMSPAPFIGNESQSPTAEKRDFWSTIMEWIGKWFAMLPGAVSNIK